MNTNGSNERFIVEGISQPRSRGTIILHRELNLPQTRIFQPCKSKEARAYMRSQVCG